MEQHKVITRTKRRRRSMAWKDLALHGPPRWGAILCSGVWNIRSVLHAPLCYSKATTLFLLSHPWKQHLPAAVIGYVSNDYLFYQIANKKDGVFVRKWLHSDLNMNMFCIFSIQPMRNVWLLLFLWWRRIKNKTAFIVCKASNVKLPRFSYSSKLSIFHWHTHSPTAGFLAIATVFRFV